MVKTFFKDILDLYLPIKQFNFCYHMAFLAEISVSANKTKHFCFCQERSLL